MLMLKHSIYPLMLLKIVTVQPTSSPALSQVERPYLCMN